MAGCYFSCSAGWEVDGVVGVDLRPPGAHALPFPILRADAANEPLPEADVAISNWLAHHLSEDDFISLIRNVGRSCRRFIVFDLVRSRLPLVLFRTFIAPFLTAVNAADGCTSIRRAFTPDEMLAIVRKALEGTGATFRYSRTPFRSRQMVDHHPLSRNRLGPLQRDLDPYPRGYTIGDGDRRAEQGKNARGHGRGKTRGLCRVCSTLQVEKRSKNLGRAAGGD